MNGLGESQLNTHQYSPRVQEIFDKLERKKVADRHRHETLTANKINTNKSKIEEFRINAQTFDKLIKSILHAQSDNIRDKGRQKNLRQIKNQLKAFDIILNSFKDVIDLILTELDKFDENNLGQKRGNLGRLTLLLDICQEYISIIRSYWKYKAMILQLDQQFLKDNGIDKTFITIEFMVISSSNFISWIFKKVFNLGSNLPDFTDNAIIELASLLQEA